jgi:hypothetical protein
MKKIVITMDEKGNIITDFDGFPGPGCYEEALRLAATLKELGVDIKVQEIHPKRDASVAITQPQTVREG